MPKLPRLGFRVPLLDMTRRAPTVPKFECHRITGRALQERNARMMRENPYCVECMKQGINNLVDEWDHIIALADGGTDDESNMQGLCHEHHDEKSKRESIARNAGNTHAM